MRSIGFMVSFRWMRTLLARMDRAARGRTACAVMLHGGAIHAALRARDNAMPEAWIIDACRTPRGIGKYDKGALANIHPQQLGRDRAQGARRAQRHRHRRCRRHHLGHRRAGRHAGRRPRPHGGARCRLRHQVERRHARPLLRLRHHHGEHRRGLDHGRARGPGDRRRHRDDVDAGPAQRGRTARR